MSGDGRGIRSIGWRYYSGSAVDFYWPWILFGVVWLGVSLWLSGGFASQPTKGPAIEAVADAQTAPSLPCPALALGGPPSLIGIGAAVAAATDSEADQATLAGCTAVAKALSGWRTLADGRGTDVAPDDLRATQGIDRTWQSDHICSLSPAWGDYRPIVAHMVASGVVEACDGGRWAARLPLVRGTGMSADLAQFLTFALIVVPMVLLVFLMGRSWRTRLAFRWLYQSQHG